MEFYAQNGEKWTVKNFSKCALARLGWPGHADAVNLRIKVDTQGEATCCSAPVRPAGQHSHHQVASAACFISTHVPFICLAISNNGGFTGALPLQHWYKSQGYDAGLGTARECLDWSANVFHRCPKSPFSSSGHPGSFFKLKKCVRTYHYL